MTYVPTPIYCVYCGTKFFRRIGASARRYCYRLQCEQHHEAVRKKLVKEQRADMRQRYKALGYYRKGGKFYEAKEKNPIKCRDRLWEKGQPKIKCKKCKQLKPGPFEICFDCRQDRREQIDTDYMFEMWGGRFDDGVDDSPSCPVPDYL